MIAGLISIGTNSTRALAADVSGGAAKTLLHRSTGTRIGEGLRERGHLDEAAMQRTLQAIREHCEAMAPLQPRMHAIATSALRRADNAAEFAKRVSEIAGAELQIISGDDEARYSFIGAVSGFERHEDERYGVLDTGGGSTEYAAGSKSGPDRIVSCEIGAVRLTEAVPELSGTHGAVSESALDRARGLTASALREIGSFEKVDRLVFVGGSATTLVALLAGKREPFTYAPLSRAGLHNAIQTLRSTALQERKALGGMNPQRADILLAGALILDEVFARTLHERATVSTNDLLLGFLLRCYLSDTAA